MAALSAMNTVNSVNAFGLGGFYIPRAYFQANSGNDAGGQSQVVSGGSVLTSGNNLNSQNQVTQEIISVLIPNYRKRKFIADK